MLKTEVYSLNMGPQHPSTHGVLRVVLDLDGEIVQHARPDIGFLHRGIEKLMESRTYAQVNPYTDRLDYVSSMSNNLAYCLAVEKLLQVEIPERAEYLRVIMAELNRIASHCICQGSVANDLGAITAFIYAFRIRERILDLFNMACGARMTYHYIRIGGVMADITEDFIKAAWQFVNDYPGLIGLFKNLVSDNEIFRHRLMGTGVISGERALALGISGPVLRASGVGFDLRKEDPYSIYDRFDFDVPVTQNGDNWDRYILRLDEMDQSIRIIRQALEKMSEGPVMAKVPKIIKPPAGEVYHRIESPRGELGFYIVSDGSTKPYRIHVRRPSFINLSGVDDMCRSGKLSDVVAVLATVDPILGEVDC
ncbi:NADH-quinone oxidoreductase subunit D [Acetonema longum]|uniref:NADH-quinone oxidoreductase subunit D n=1 Tax=Acetonema longum DSM 6540 TaxID=1009370 RepID=F7NDE2_9FIRM|nr:NADH-quinone oxidoreductase subunit D [Acetonema longum]EGO65974.1 proton-translocating NADH-ubiquinone oxidoreductase, chain d [Acetonema longum DSM 6540]